MEEAYFYLRTKGNKSNNELISFLKTEFGNSLVIKPIKDLNKLGENAVLIANEDYIDDLDESLSRLNNSTTLILLKKSASANEPILTNERIDGFISLEGLNISFWNAVLIQAKANRAFKQNQLKNLLRNEIALESISAGVWDWQIIDNKPAEWWSPKVYEILGYEQGEIEPTIDVFERIVHPDFLIEWREEKTRFIKEKNRFEINAKAIKKSGTEIWITTTGQGFFNNQGDLIRIIGSVADTTIKNELINDVTINEALLRESQNVAKTGTFTIKLDNNKIWCSGQIKELLEIDAPITNINEQIVSSSIHPDDKIAFNAVLNNGIDNKTDGKLNFKFITKTGAIKYYQLLIKYLFKEKLLMGTIQDITENELSRSKIEHYDQKNKEVLDTFPIDISIYNPDFTYQFINQKAAEKISLNESVIGLTDVEYLEKTGLPSTIGQTRQEKLKQAIDSKESIYWTEINTLNGNKVVWLKAAHPIYDRSQLLKIVCSSLDLTKEYEIEQSLKFRVKFENLLIQLSNKLINVQVNQIDDVINEGLSEIGKLAKVDRAYIFQYKNQRSTLENTHEWCANGVKSFINELKDIPSDHFSHLETVLQEGSIYKINHIDELPQGAINERAEFEKEGIQSVLIAPIVRNYSISGFIGFDLVKTARTWNEELEDFINLAAQVISNAFDRLHSLDAIIDSEEKFRTLTEKANASIFITRDSRFVYANPETTRLTGYDLDDIYTMNLIDIFGKHEEKSISKSIKSIMSNASKNLRNERMMVAKGGEQKYIDITSNSIFYNGENAIISIAIDVTEKHKKDEERIALIDRLTQQNQDLEQFSYIISHNLRSPVAGIIGLISIIDKDSYNNELNTEVLNRIESSANNLDRVIQDLNEIISVKKNTHQRKQNIYFEELLSEFKSAHAEMIKTAKGIINIDVSKAASIKSIKPYLDSIISNLLTNALKYKKVKENAIVTFETKRQNEYIELIISDNGMGIDLKKYRSKLFKFKQRFHLNIEGQGIGLYLVKTQVEAIGGTIEIESTINVGTRFIVRIPD